MRDNTELNAITAVIVGFCALGLASSIWPAVEYTANVAFGLIFGLGGLAVLALSALASTRLYAGRDL